VNSVDTACKRATELGAKIHMPKTEVKDHGWFAMISDPQGAMLHVWENVPRPAADKDKAADKDNDKAKTEAAKETAKEKAADDTESESKAKKRKRSAKDKEDATPADTPKDPFSWHNLITPDPKAAKDFYASLFDWAPVTNDIGGAKFDGWYLDKTNQKEKAPHAGYMAPPAPSKTACWMSYITVPDVDAAVKMASDLGGKVHKAATDIPGLGRFAVLGDNVGVSFCVFAAAVPEKKKRAKRTSSKGGERTKKTSRKASGSKKSKSKQKEVDTDASED